MLLVCGVTLPISIPTLLCKELRLLLFIGQMFPRWLLLLLQLPMGHLLIADAALVPGSAPILVLGLVQRDAQQDAALLVILTVGQIVVLVVIRFAPQLVARDARMAVGVIAPSLVEVHVLVDAVMVPVRVVALRVAQVVEVLVTADAEMGIVVISAEILVPIHAEDSVLPYVTIIAGEFVDLIVPLHVILLVLGDVSETLDRSIRITALVDAKDYVLTKLRPTLVTILVGLLVTANVNPVVVECAAILAVQRVQIIVVTPVDIHVREIVRRGVDIIVMGIVGLPVPPQ